MFFSDPNENKIIEALDNIEKFVNGEINAIPKVNFKGKGFNQKIVDKLSSINDKLTTKNQDELMIYGEIMLIAEKLSDGFIEDKIYFTNT